MVFVQMFFIFCSNEKENSMMKIELTDNWEFQEAGKAKWLPAKVPGCVHNDLLSNKIIEDPFYRINEKELQWIGETDWVYRTNFTVDDKEINYKNLNLVFHGLDTYAKVYLNDNLLLETDNMFRTWRADVKQLLKPGQNTLGIEFRSVFKENLPKWENAPFRLMAFDNNDQAEIKLNLYSRKAGFHYGWDWGPRLVTAGIWKPVLLECWKDFRFDNVQVIQDEISQDMAKCRAIFEIHSDREQPVDLIVENSGRRLCKVNKKLERGKNLIEVKFEIQNPQLWWTNGLGEQHLYDLRFIAENNNEKIVKSEKIGIRKLQVVREDDEFGKSLYVKLNDIPVFMKGANYIPQDNFQSRVTTERYEFIIKSAAEANMNMLRVWGGGIYENDIFYDLCDQYGILVWQDIMFACGMYPGDDEFLENVTCEVKDNVKRLRNHPSIALWCGNNENEVSWYAWGWKYMYDAETQKTYEKDMKKLFREVIPTAIKSVDPTRYYHPTSPNTGYNNISYNEGDVHDWSIWHGKAPFSNYGKWGGRFMSEWGFQSFPDFNTVKKFTIKEDWKLDSEVMEAHQRCMSEARKDKKYGTRLIKQYMARWYNKPKDFKTMLYVSQLLHAKDIEIAVDQHRGDMPRCMGTLYWQIDDCWPVASWSSIDYYGNWKAAHYAARKAYEPILIIPKIQEDKIHIMVISDKLEPVKGQLSLQLFDFQSNLKMEKNLEITIPENTAKIQFIENVDKILNNCNPSEVVLKLQVIADNEVVSSRLCYFKPEKDLVLRKPQISHSIIEKNDRQFEINLTTEQLAKNVYITTKENYLHLSDNYFDLLPGISKIVTFSSDIALEELKKNLVIMSLIDTY